MGRRFAGSVLEDWKKLSLILAHLMTGRMQPRMSYCARIGSDEQAEREAERQASISYEARADDERLARNG